MEHYHLVTRCLLNGEILRGSFTGAKANFNLGTHFLSTYTACQKMKWVAQ